jgi:hypothetical protein
MSFLEALALAILFFNLGKNEQQEWQSCECHVAVLKYEPYNYYPKIDDSIMQYFQDKRDTNN